MEIASMSNARAKKSHDLIVLILAGLAMIWVKSTVPDQSPSELPVSSITAMADDAGR